MPNEELNYEDFYSEEINLEEKPAKVLKSGRFFIWSGVVAVGIAAFMIFVFSSSSNNQVKGETNSQSFLGSLISAANKTFSTIFGNGSNERLVESIDLNSPIPSDKNEKSDAGYKKAAQVSVTNPKITGAANLNNATQIPAQEEKININTADQTELDRLFGVGPAVAQKIIDYRIAHGVFYATEDIKEVKGIGDVTFEKMKDQITVGDVGPRPIPPAPAPTLQIQSKQSLDTESPALGQARARPGRILDLSAPPNSGGQIGTALVVTPVTAPQPIVAKININTAGLEELDKIIGVGAVIAKNIIDYRVANGVFYTIEDIKGVKGIGDVTFEKMKDQITVGNVGVRPVPVPPPTPSPVLLPAVPPTPVIPPALPIAPSPVEPTPPLPILPTTQSEQAGTVSLPPSEPVTAPVATVPPPAVPPTPEPSPDPAPIFPADDLSSAPLPEPVTEPLPAPEPDSTPSTDSEQASPPQATPPTVVTPPAPIPSASEPSQTVPEPVPPAAPPAEPPPPSPPTLQSEQAEPDSTNSPQAETIPVPVEDPSPSQTQESLPAPAPVINHLLISEIMAGISDNSSYEFIELYNPTSSAIDLTNWIVKKKTSTGSESALVVSSRLQGKIIEPGHYFLLGNDGGYAGSPAADVLWPHSYTLAYSSNTVAVYDANGDAVDSVSWGDNIKDKSYERESWSGTAFRVESNPNPQNSQN